MYNPPHNRPSYTGPIERVGPGHVLAAERLEEYQAYMRKTHGFIPKLWGPNEEWQDSGLRPFQQASSPKDPILPQEPNPFDGQ